MLSNRTIYNLSSYIADDASFYQKELTDLLTNNISITILIKGELVSGTQEFLENKFSLQVLWY